MDKSWIPTTAGALDIVAGIASLIGCFALFFAAIIVANIPDGADEFPLPIVSGFLCVLAVLVLLLGVIAIIGGLSALNRRRWAWALVGSIAAAFVCPPLGLPAIILTALAQEQIQGGG